MLFEAKPYFEYQGDTTNLERLNEFFRRWDIAKENIAPLGELTPIKQDSKAEKPRFYVVEFCVFTYKLNWDVPIEFTQNALAIAERYTEGKQQTEIVPENEATTTGKLRKKLIPKERDTNEGLLLIYEMFEKYKINFLDELPAAKAWGKITSGEFTSDLIRRIGERKNFIVLNGGETLNKTDFSDKYRRRFKK